MPRRYGEFSPYRQTVDVRLFPNKKKYFGPKDTHPSITRFGNFPVTHVPVTTLYDRPGPRARVTRIRAATRTLSALHIYRSHSPPPPPPPFTTTGQRTIILRPVLLRRLLLRARQVLRRRRIVVRFPSRRPAGPPPARPVAPTTTQTHSCTPAPPPHATNAGAYIT